MTDVTLRGIFMMDSQSAATPQELERVAMAGEILRLREQVKRHRKAIDEVTASIKAARLENPLVAGVSDWLGSLSAILTRPW